MTEPRACYFVVCVDGDIDLEDPAMLRYYELAIQAEIETETSIDALTEEGRPTVVTGSLPGHGIGIERYPSMDQFWNYWKSDLYGEAKQIRRSELSLRIAFAMCLPGRPASGLPPNGPDVGWSVSVVDDKSEFGTDVVAIASADELEVVEGENPFPEYIWIVRIHPSRKDAEAASPPGALLHAVMSGVATEGDAE